MKGIGIAQTHAIQIMDRIKDNMYYFFTDPAPKYIGSVGCFVPPGLPFYKPILFGCYAKEPDIKSLCKELCLILAGYKDVIDVIAREMTNEFTAYREEYTSMMQEFLNTLFWGGFSVLGIYFFLLVLPQTFVAEKKVSRREHACLKLSTGSLLKSFRTSPKKC